jgi:tRNA G10  N-methylase Trm11
MDAAIADVLSSDLTQTLFSPRHQVLPNLNDIYELEIAFYEHHLLSDEELLRNAAYFAKVGDVYTNHFLMCTGESLKLPNHSSVQLKSFFEKNIFRTGYATHGLFPYRGKFHPQMIKGLMNIMGLKRGHVVLDPMMGSGTVLVEACLMGIQSIGVDTSPFCRFMAQTKLDVLTMSLTRARAALSNYEKVFSYFQNKVGQPRYGDKATRKKVTGDIVNIMENTAEYAAENNGRKPKEREQDTLSTFNFLLLAYLDSVGYAERSNRKSPLEQFRAILDRYLFVADKIQNFLAGFETGLAPAEVFEGDARALPLDDASIDGIIFSPPYSFAIDYLENDAFHLNYFGVDLDKLRENMIGLRGRTLSDKFKNYQEDMDKVLAECARVLRPSCYCTIIVGTNNNQLAKVTGVSPNEVIGLHDILCDRGSHYSLKKVKMMSRPITGISNTMRREYILILQRM